MASWIESIDVNAYVQKLMQMEVGQIDKVTQSKLGQLSDEEKGLKARISSYGQIQSLMDTFQQKITDLTKKFNPTFSVISSNENVATSTIEGSVSPGNHTLTVAQLAQASQTASALVSSDNTALNKTTTLTIGVGSNSFNLNVTSTDTLQTIASRINTSASVNSVGVFASVVSTGTNQYRLVVSSTQTGTANAASISETGVGADALDISTVLSQARNAQFTLDTLSYDLPSNSALISGLNLNLLSVGSTTFSVNQTNSVTTTKQAIEDVVNSYNDIMKTIAKLQVNSDVSDPTLTMLQSTLANSMSSTVFNNLGIVPTPHNEIEPIKAKLANGDEVTVQPRGLLSIKDDPITGETLLNKLTAGFSAIQSQLVGTTGILAQVSTKLDSTTGSIWKIFNHSQYGSLVKANERVVDLDDQIAGVQRDAQGQKDALILKYAQLDMLLNNLQVKSQYLTQQLEVMKSSK